MKEQPEKNKKRSKREKKKENVWENTNGEIKKKNTERTEKQSFVR
jgi:hypothetical protein